MQCVEFENRLNEVLDERGCPELDILLASHAHHCEACQLLLSRYELICETAGNLCVPSCRPVLRSVWSASMWNPGTACGAAGRTPRGSAALWRA